MCNGMLISTLTWARKSWGFLATPILQTMFCVPRKLHMQTGGGSNSLSLSLCVFILVLGTIILLDILWSIRWMVTVTPLIITHTGKRCIKRLWLSYHLRDYTIRPVMYDWVPRYLLVSACCCIKFLPKGL